MKTNNKVICVLTFLLLPVCTVFGQIGGDCEIAHWGAVVGGISSESEGVCEYEVDDWSSPNYLELDIQPLIQSSPQIHHFQFYCDMSGIDFENSGGFRPFEILTDNGKPWFSIDFGWASDRLNTNPPLTIVGRVFNFNDELKQDTTMLDVGLMKLIRSFEGFMVQISWKPDSALDYGWVEFFVNGYLVGRLDGMHSENFWPPRIVRFGSTVLPLKPPTGVFRIGPVNPAPYAFHL